MNKLWAKIIKNDKIKKDYVLPISSFNSKNLYDYLKQICYELKIETPIVLTKHTSQMEEYGMTKFSKDDFVDYIDFDSLILNYLEQP